MLHTSKHDVAPPSSSLITSQPFSLLVRSIFLVIELATCQIEKVAFLDLAFTNWLCLFFHVDFFNSCYLSVYKVWKNLRKILRKLYIFMIILRIWRRRIRIWKFFIIHVWHTYNKSDKNDTYTIRFFTCFVMFAQFLLLENY